MPESPTELSRNDHQGLFGESFVQALASAAGLTVARKNLDRDGVDFTIGFTGDLGGMRHPEIQVQVKSWMHKWAAARDGCWKYRMRTKYFNELAGPRFTLPRFLVLVIVPDNWVDYALAKSDAMELRYGAYWQSLLDHEPVTLTGDTTVKVDVPQANLLTVNTLHTLMMPRKGAR